MPIKVRYNGLEVDGNLVPLISGSLHYWRLDPEKWGFILDQVKSLGFRMVETYIPWSIHESANGDYDFGKIDPAKNLDKFLSLCEEKGLKILVRPGPHINSELPDFGYPSRVLEGEEFWSRDALGAPCVLAHMTSQFRVPSYANEGLINAYEPFLAALTPILQKHLHPHGGILGIQVDNEAGYFFRPGTYDNDYSEPSLALYRHFLEMKYRQLKQLNEAYGSKHKSFDVLEPPRGPELESRGALRRGLDWAEYKEYQLLWFLSKMAGLFKSKGLGSVPFFHNYYGPWDAPFNLSDIERDAGIDICGLDSYCHAENSSYSLDQARYLSAHSQLPYFPEYGAGTWPLDTVARDLHDHEANILAPLMGGARALNFYMLVERERWVGSPISASGELRPELAGLFSRFNTFLEEQEWTKSSPQHAALLMESRETQQLLASTMRPGHLGERGFFPYELWRLPLDKALLGATAELGSARAFYESGQAWLRENSFSYALGDTSIPTEKIKKYSFAIASCWGYLEESAAKRLRAFVESGGYLVLGPELPRLNGRFEPLQAFAGVSIEEGKAATIGDGKILFLSSFDSKVVANFIRKGKVVPEVSLSDTSLEMALHKSGGRSILFVRNPNAEERPCTVMRDGKFVLKPLWSRGKFLGAVEEREVRLGAHEIKVWEVIPC
jgi:beta-galactosidase